MLEKESKFFTLRKLIFVIMPLFVFGSYIILAFFSGLENIDAKIDVAVFLDYKNLFFQAAIFLFLFLSVYLGILILPNLDLNDFGFRKIKSKDILKALGLVFIIYFVNIASSLILLGFNKDIAEQPFLAGDTSSLIQPLTILGIIVLSITVAYAEETFFRSYLFYIMRKLPNILKLLISSFVFSIGHIYQGSHAIIVTFLIGMVLGHAYLKTKNIHIVVLAHAIYDILAFAQVLYLFRV